MPLTLSRSPAAAPARPAEDDRMLPIGRAPARRQIRAAVGVTALVMAARMNQIWY